MESILQNPIYATSIGLVDHGFKQMNEGLIAEKNQSWLSKLLNIVKSEY
jgi:cell division protein FtsA